MKVFEPLRRYSSPSRFALACMRPNASEPESASVIAHAPTLSNVSRSSAHRSFCATVPRLMIVPGGEAGAHAHRGDQTRRAPAQLDDRQQHEARAGPPPWPRSLASSTARRMPWLARCSFAMRFANDDARHLVHAEGACRACGSRRTAACRRTPAPRAAGRTSFSTKSRTASRIILCSSLHSYMRFRSCDSVAGRSGPASGAARSSHRRGPRLPGTTLGSSPDRRQIGRQGRARHRGRTRGLGAQIARRFRDEGATPIVTDLSETGLPDPGRRARR